MAPRSVRRLLAILLAAAALLAAGCVTPTPEAPGTPPADDPLPTATTLPWGFEDCVFVNWFVPVEAAALRPHLPPGFEPGNFQGLPIDVGPATAYLGFEAFRCTSGTGLNGDVPDMEYASFFTDAMPPENLVVEGAALHLFKWDTLVPDADRRALLLDAGMPVHDGSATNEIVPGPLGALRVAGSFRFDAGGTYSYEGGPALFAGDDGGQGIRFVEYSPAGNGLALWQAEFALHTFSSGRGLFRVPAGSWAASVIGAETGEADYFAGQWSFRNASLTLPPAGGCEPACEASG